VDIGYVERDPVDLVVMNNEERVVQEEQRKRENKAKLWIQNSLDDSILSKIPGVVTSKHVWDILSTTY